jgi:hypothetical protein
VTPLRANAAGRVGAAVKATNIVIGTSGWVYRDWRGRVYLDDLPQDRWLGYLSQRLSTIEIQRVVLPPACSGAL